MATKYTLLLLWSVVTVVQSATVHLYVSPSGNDANDGQHSTHPIKTLQHAVGLLSAFAVSDNTVFVELMQGYHDLSATLHLQTLGGTVVFRAYQGQEVHVTGGQQLSSSDFHPVTDTHVLQRLPQAARTKVVELNLTAAGINDLGILRNYGFGKTWNAPLELFINGRPLTLAEWPNANFINIKSVPDGQNGRRFTYDAEGHDLNWAHETEPWAYGWWYWSWADMSIPVERVNVSTHTITLKEASSYGLRVGHYDPATPTGQQVGFSDQGGYFRMVNLLCEIDQSGEYYIDRVNKKVYVWPNTPQETLTSSDVVYVSMIDNCVRVENTAQNVHFEDFSLEACRYIGFHLVNARNITFQNLEIKNTGATGIQCSGDCRGITVQASEIHDVGGGVFLDGGEIAHLTSSANIIRDNHIWDHARYGAQPNFGVKIGGVHATVAHNHIHHGQYTGIWWSGNDHVIEYNHVHHECWNSSDCGAIHSGRDWSWRGNVIRHNHIHNIQRHHPGADVRGIMLDDEYSSVLIEHNVFYDNEVHANIGGGRDSVIRYNVMYNAFKYSIQLDGRGLGSSGHGTYLRDKLSHTPYRTDLWRTRYPELYTILDHHPEAPEGNQIYDNVFYNKMGIERIHFSGGGLDRPDYFNVHDNFRAVHTSNFWSPANADFRLRCQAEQWGNTVHFPATLTQDQVGPMVGTGPNYIRVNRHTVSPHTSVAPAASCDSSTVAPATSAPRGSYMPDGSSANHLYPNISHEGCWFIIDHCPNHPEAEGMHKNAAGTQECTEDGCLARAAPQWQYCGSPSNGRVVVVYGPTGAMTFSAEGCYFADWGCQTDQAGYIHRDSWAEQNANASHNEAACLNRASPQWRYCGASPNRPVTSIYGPSGALRTGGAGCWIKIPSCPANHMLEGYFFDAWGATNLNTGSDRAECFDRANFYWMTCGSHNNATVTAYYRPDGASHTVPS